MEPDCAFYLDERAWAYRAAAGRGRSCGRRHSSRRTPPDLVVEVEITHADKGKIERYGDIGVRELWQPARPQGDARFLRADFFALQPARPPRRLAASAVLAGLTPGDVCEAADSVRFCLTRDERTEAVARIVRRRRRASERVREAEALYAAPPGQELLPQQATD